MTAFDEFKLLANILPGLVYRAYWDSSAEPEIFGGDVDRMTGFSIEELKRASTLPTAYLMSSSDRERWRREVIQAAADDRPFKIEYALRHKNGSLRQVIEHGCTIPRSNGDTMRIYGGVFDLANFRSLAQRRQQSEAMRRALSAGQLDLLETERKRIAGELHDSVGQLLTSIKMRVESTAPPAGAAKCSECDELLIELVPMIRRAMDETRRIAMGLRPPILDDLGIVAAIRWFCRDFTASNQGVQVDTDLCIEESEISDNLKIVLYRTLQEAMTNIAKHSHADKVCIRLSKVAASLEFVVEDNGSGFNSEVPTGTGGDETSVGLTSMRERVELAGGSFTIRARGQRGTEVRVILPDVAGGASSLH